jgi:hypothetical protein
LLKFTARAFQIARIGKAKFGAGWIGNLAERERWLIKRYIEPQHGAASSILPGTITYVGPGGPFVPVNDLALAAEVERARDRLEQMNDQYEQVYASRCQPPRSKAAQGAV